MNVLNFLSWDVLRSARAEAVHELAGTNGKMLAVFWGAIILAAVVTYLKSAAPRTPRGIYRFLFPAETLRHASARADILFWLSRRIWMPLLVLPLVISTATAGQATHALLVAIFGAPAHPPGHAGPWTLVAFTVTMFLAYDISYYFYHVMQHHVPFMWELHKVHHSAEVLVGVTDVRVHPLDEIMNRWWDGLIPGFAYGIWSFHALNPVELTVFGLNVYFLRNAVLMMDFVRHTHFKFTYGRVLDSIFLSPLYHQLHHSIAQEHWNKNYGLALSIWDRIFGTLVVPKPDQDFVFGLQNHEADEYQSLLRLHLVPLRNISLMVWRRCRPARPAPAGAPGRPPPFPAQQRQ